MKRIVRGDNTKKVREVVSQWLKDNPNITITSVNEYTISRNGKNFLTIEINYE